MINKVFDWGVQHKRIIGNTDSPLMGMIVDIKDEKAPDILGLEEIKKLLTAAKATGHHWYPIWSFAIIR